MHVCVLSSSTASQQLVALQGVGKSLRVPARNRLIDDLLLKALQQLAADGGDGSGKHTAVQVVNIGCGMASQPWRLQKPVQLAVLSWYDVDQPAVMQHKQQLLQQAGAALGPPTATPATQQPAANTAVSQAQFPLLVDRWQPVAADLSQTSLASCLEAHGFDRQRPTVWLAEALLYYLPLDKVRWCDCVGSGVCTGKVCSYDTSTGWGAAAERERDVCMA